MQKTLCFYFLLFTFSFSHAQQFGGNPSSQHWKQINTDTARIIYPVGMDSSANRVASLVHYLAAQKPVSIGDQLKKINIVLQDLTVVANGYVGLGPFRSEFFLTPDPANQSLGSIPWSDQLTLHEYRHVQQINNFNHGISKVMKVISGEQGYDLAINAAIPNWFFEGDAVYVETVLSKQGRGRLPLFINAYPSLWEGGKKYNWMKLRNGSLKDYVPNHYNLGYLLVNYGREKYGPGFWTKVTRDASAYKGLIYPFQSAIKQHAGVDYKTFREEAFEFYKKAFRLTQGEREAERRDEYLLPVKKEYVNNYLFPYTAGTDSLVYQRSDYRHRPAFYIKDKNGERRIRVRDISIEDQFSYRNGKIVYAAYETHPRWSWKDHSEIRILDVSTGQQKTLRSKTKYFTPDISADGSRVAAVQYSKEGKSELHVLSTADGQVLYSLHSPEINLFTDPKFTQDNQVVTAARLNDGKMALVLAEPVSGRLTRLTNPSFNVIGYPSINNDIIWFTASYNGNDDVFALRMNDKKIFKVTDGPLGNYYVNAANGKITWSAFTAEGYQLKQLNEKDIKWDAVAEATTIVLKERFAVSNTKGTEDILERVPGRVFATSKYRKSTGLLNFHSWRPYFSDPIFTYSLYGENVLNTLQSELFYSYNRNDKTNAVGFFTTYGAFFPHITGGVEYTFDNTSEIGNRIRRWAQLDTRIGLNIPLSYVKGRTIRNFSLGNYYILRNEFNKGFYKDSLGKTSFSYLLHSLSWTQQVQRAVQHIYPRFAYSLSMNHRHAITEVNGYQFGSNALLYVPGLLSTHTIGLTGSFQQRDTLGQIVFANRFAYSRGYEGRYFSRMWKLSANYHFPLLYPDWGFGNIFYLMRLRANAFYDFTRVYSADKSLTADQRSVGGEIFMDTKWWNQYPLTFGVRISRLLDPDQFDGSKGTVFEFVLPVAIIPR